MVTVCPWGNVEANTTRSARARACMIISSSSSQRTRVRLAVHIPGARIKLRAAPPRLSRVVAIISYEVLSSWLAVRPTLDAGEATASIHA